MNQSTKRILKDYLEIKKSDEIISAIPLENNLYEWHANIAPKEGRYKGIVLHIIINLLKDYPYSPPKIKLCTFIPHSNVINYNGIKNFICLDMLNNFFWMENGTDERMPYSGWSSSYTIKTIMLQLETFLFNNFIENYDGSIKDTLYDMAPEEGGGVRKQVQDKLYKAFKEASEFKCSCGHCYKKPYPILGYTVPKIKSNKFIERIELISKKNSLNNYKILPKFSYILDVIFKKLKKKELNFLDNFIKSCGCYSIKDFAYKVNCNCNYCIEIKNYYYYIDLNKILSSNKISRKDLDIIFIFLCKKELSFVWKIIKESGYKNDLTLIPLITQKKKIKKNLKIIKRDYQFLLYYQMIF